jgi:hypothetical protein
VITFDYRFTFNDRDQITFNLQVDEQRMMLINPSQERAAWTALNFHQCPNCPLSPEQTPDCPVATNLIDLLHACKTMVSYDAVLVEVTTAERHVSLSTTVQRGVGSILGLLIATSSCPHTEFLKPMARFHLPFACEEETIYRTTSMYLLAQYFRSKHQMSFEISFNGLTEIYTHLQIMNKALSERLKSATEKDGTVNAIILLDLFSKAVNWSIEDELIEFEPLFNRYLT